MYYGEWQGREIDAVGFAKGVYTCMEVKYQPRVAEKEFAWAHGGMWSHPLFVLTKDTLHLTPDVALVPAEVFLSFDFNEARTQIASLLKRPKKRAS